jgi:hypothetical protein
MLDLKKYRTQILLITLMVSGQFLAGQTDGRSIFPTVCAISIIDLYQVLELRSVKTFLVIPIKKTSLNLRRIYVFAKVAWRHVLTV